jgi:hypothetical protein
MSEEEDHDKDHSFPSLPLWEYDEDSRKYRDAVL